MKYVFDAGILPYLNVDSSLAYGIYKLCTRWYIEDKPEKKQLCLNNILFILSFVMKHKDVSDNVSAIHF